MQKFDGMNLIMQKRFQHHRNRNSFEVTSTTVLHDHCFTNAPKMLGRGRTFEILFSAKLILTNKRILNN